jgi:hypothetical protein
VGGFLTALGKISKVTSPPSSTPQISHVGLGIDSSLSDNFGRTAVGALSVITTFLTISIVGGPQFVLFIVIIGSLYWNGEYFSALPSLTF